MTALSPQVATDEIDAVMRSLYARFGRKIHSFCSQQLRSHEEAEDATQLTFLNAFRGLERGASLEYESAWLFKIAHNVCLNSQRSLARRRRIEMPTDPGALESYAHPAHELNELFGLSDALRALPERQRQAILLREWRGLSYKEIAAELDLSEAAVETVLFRARGSLSQALTKETSAGRRNRLGLIGSLLATPQHLLLGSGAKVAATVATVVATVASVATPAARHDLAGGLDWAARQIAAEIRPGPKQNPPRRESRASNDLGRIPSFVAAPRSWSPMPGRTSRFAAAGTPASAVGDRAGSADVTSPAPTPGPDSSGPAPPATPAASVSSVTASSSPTGASTAQSVGTDASQAGNSSGGADAKPPTPPESEADSDAPGGSASAAHGNSGAGKPSDLPDGAKAAQGGGEDASHEAGSGQGGGSLHSGTAEAGDETDQPDDATDQTDDANGQADTLDPDTVDRQPSGNVDSAGNGGDHTADGSGRGTKGLADSTDNSTR